MKIIEVKNLIQASGTADYKGLDIDNIVSGTQLYPDYDNVAYFHYDGEAVDHADVSVITPATYAEHKQRIDNKPQPLTPEEGLLKLREDMNTAIMELSMAMAMGGNV